FPGESEEEDEEGRADLYQEEEGRYEGLRTSLLEEKHGLLTTILFET
ncbi:hypothetical protein CEXT_223441, partial [Caerostris extrusa]